MEYTKEQVKKIIADIIDKAQNEEKHDEWQKEAEKAIKRFKKKGIKIKKVQNSQNGMYMLDKELSARTAAPTQQDSQST
jgi:TRAP-type C4-dicarboxylate transport system substrate-binding protein